MNRGTKSQQMNMCAQSQLDNQGSGGGMNGCVKTANNEHSWRHGEGPDHEVSYIVD